MKTPIDIHSCSYYCDRPECVKEQRNELREKYMTRYAALSEDYKALYASVDHTALNNDFKTRLAEAIEQMPFGDTAASFAQFVREFK